MRKECTIGVKLQRYDIDGYVKPFFYNLPYSPKMVECSFDYHGMSKLVIDSKCIGIMFDFFYALSKPKETDFKLNVILTDEKEVHKGWIELRKKYKDYCEYEVHGLNNYKGESHGDNHGPGINLTELYGIPNPEYIYLKKI